MSRIVVLRPTVLPAGIETLPDGCLRVVGQPVPGDEMPDGTYELVLDEMPQAGDYVAQSPWFKGWMLGWKENETHE